MKPALLFACAAITLADAAPAAERKACQLLTVDEWSVRERYYRPVIDGAINGHKIGIMLDTGATHSVVWRNAVDRLGLRTFQAPNQRYFTVEGEEQVDATDIAELRIGKAVRKNWRALVFGQHPIGGDVALLLGDDFFGQVDIEFNLAARAVKVFKANNCEGAWLGYWGKEVLAIPLESAEKIQFYVQINGKPVLAMLDSGAPVSKMSLEAAAELGITPQSAGVVSGGCVRTPTRNLYDTWIATFRSFAIGDEVIRDAKLHFAPLFNRMRKEELGSALRRRLDGLPDMLLGADFLHSHRVLVSHSQRRMYFSYTGGTVFPAEPGKPCSAYQTK